MEKVRAGASIIQTIEAHALRTYPYEACGLLYGHADNTACTVSSAKPMDNAERADARSRFSISPDALLQAHKTARQQGLKIVGHYHSHPNGSAEPSAKDVDSISDGNAVWMIQSLQGGVLGSLRAFRPCSDLAGFKALEMIVLKD